MVYIKIFNRKLNKNILIGNEAYVNFEPKDWNVENPHVVINIENFDFYQHTFNVMIVNHFMNHLAQKHWIGISSI